MSPEEAWHELKRRLEADSRYDDCALLTILASDWQALSSVAKQAQLLVDALSE